MFGAVEEIFRGGLFHYDTLIDENTTVCIMRGVPRMDSMYTPAILCTTGLRDSFMNPLAVPRMNPKNRLPAVMMMVFFRPVMSTGADFHIT